MCIGYKPEIINAARTLFPIKSHHNAGPDIKYNKATKRANQETNKEKVTL